MNDGALTRTGQARLALRALQVNGAAFPGLLRGVRSAAAAAAPTAPDSRLCRDAYDEAISVLSSTVFRHSLRSWEFAVALAEVDGLTPDPEALYVACLLHDTSAGADEAGACFACTGADDARSFVLAHDETAVSRADTVRTACARHMDARSPIDAGPEARLVHDATHLDVAGSRVHDVPASVVAGVLHRHPRTGFSVEFAAVMRTEARLRPRSRAATLWRVGMRLPMALNPLDRRAGTPPGAQG